MKKKTKKRKNKIICLLAVNILRFLFILCVRYMGFLPKHMYVYHMHIVFHRGQKRTLDAMILDLKMTVSNYVDPGN